MCTCGTCVCTCITINNIINNIDINIIYMYVKMKLHVVTKMCTKMVYILTIFTPSIFQNHHTITDHQHFLKNSHQSPTQTLFNFLTNKCYCARYCTCIYYIYFFKILKQKKLRTPLSLTTKTIVTETNTPNGEDTA